MYVDLWEILIKLLKFLVFLIVPTEMNTLMKENFNRWYTIFSYYLTETIIDFPITLICSSLFSIIIYVLSSQPMELNRFAMFFAITLLVVLIAQTIGLIVGACFNVVVRILLEKTHFISILKNFFLSRTELLWDPP